MRVMVRLADLHEVEAENMRVLAAEMSSAPALCNPGVELSFTPVLPASPPRDLPNTKLYEAARGLSCWSGGGL